MDKNVSFALAMQHALAAGLRPLTRNWVYKTRSGLSAGLKRRGGLGFLPRQLNKEEQFLISLAPSLEGKTVYDIGSYEGTFSSFFARAIGPSGTLVIFEPNPICQEQTKSNLELNGFSFHLEPVALGASASRMVLTYPLSEPARSTLDAKIAQTIYEESPRMAKHAAVKVEPLDKLVRERKFKAPDLIKIDTEGFELEVLLGAEQTIRKHLPIMYIELHGADLHAKMVRQQKIFELLKSWNYVIEDLEGAAVSGSKQHTSHIFCLHSRFAPRVARKEHFPSSALMAV